ncbi:preprotein translocase subunit SecF [Actinopolyspora lacussalsi]|uniref:Uncharacterized protein n=1 Tax=Actinopolyspora righensis TaxID=995060 RepID=A0A1I6ZUP9_9ACTN|nr:hypothetical protein [Actinopolyspora righensis]MDP9640462.1 preprotein translocase subunit SecF [Actinopolyspora lacussalsi]SFT66335.1 hypothetical protein SAMN04487904_105195 [Actinopolyspora righensis]
MSARRHGLMRPGGAARVVAFVLCFGMVVGFAATSLLAAGVSGWLVISVSLLVLAVPVGAALYSGGRSRGRR